LANARAGCRQLFRDEYGPQHAEEQHSGRAIATSSLSDRFAELG